MSLSEISVSNLAVSVSVTSTLYSGRMTLISRSGDLKGDVRDVQNRETPFRGRTSEGMLLMFYGIRKQFVSSEGSTGTRGVTGQQEMTLSQSDLQYCKSRRWLRNTGQPSKPTDSAGEHRLTAVAPDVIMFPGLSGWIVLQCYDDEPQMRE